MGYCLKMVDKLLINGVVYSPGKEIASFNLSGGGSGGGVRVDWGGGDVVILSGETWQLSSGTSRVTAAILMFSTRNNLTIDLVVENQALFSACGVSNSLGSHTVNTGFEIDLTGNGRFRRRCVAGNVINITRFHRSSYWYATITVNGQFISTVGEGAAFAIQSFRRITTNTGAVSERNTTNEPSVSLQPGNCKLTIFFIDGTTQEIEFGEECPDVKPYEEPDCPLPCAVADSVIRALGG